VPDMGTQLHNQALEGLYPQNRNAWK
jgi:hypothetical protein